MSNSSETEFDFIDAYARPFFEWLHINVLPILTAVLHIIAIFLSFGLNGAFLHMCRRTKRLADPNTRLIINLITVDFIAVVIVNIPATVSALSLRWFFGDIVCYIHGVIVCMVFLNNFHGLCLICIERTWKLCNPNFYDKTFGNPNVVTASILIQWFLNGIVAIIPFWGINGLAPISYQQYQYQCNLNFTSSLGHMLAYIGWGFLYPFMFCTVCFVCILHKRRKLLREAEPNVEQKSESKVELIEKSKSPRVLSAVKERPETAPNSGSRPRTQETAVTMHDIEVTNGDEKDVINQRAEIVQETNLTKQDSGPPNVKDNRRRSVKRRRTSSLRSYDPLSDSLIARELGQMLTFGEMSDQQQEFHLAMTAVLLWIFTYLTWIPFIAVVFYKTFYTIEETWAGWWTSGIIVVDLCWIIRPIVILSHNKQIKEEVKEVLPDIWKEKAERVKSRFDQSMNTLDRSLHITPKMKRNSIKTDKPVKMANIQKQKSQKSITDESNPIAKQESKMSLVTEKIIVTPLPNEINDNSEPNIPGGTDSSPSKEDISNKTNTELK
ncbi:unnamed protein product [Owenia fusiformis]|uniref:Uncharacterized protein n=1 Tax=Owenia fusiformis TaxID=6347 RepID=A0A8J1UQY3_OWEFU|nr:unnamed protein product [Owenia fusiformis]